MTEFEREVLDGLASIRGRLDRGDDWFRRIDAHLGKLNGQVAQHAEYIVSHTQQHAVAQATADATASARSNTAVSWGQVAKLGTLLALAGSALGILWRFIE